MHRNSFDTRQIRFSGRPNPSRFVFGMPTTRSGPGPYRQQYRREYVETLSASPPKYLVVGLPHQRADKAKELSRFPELEAFLQSNYQLETQIGFLDVYRHLTPRPRETVRQPHRNRYSDQAAFHSWSL